MKPIIVDINDLGESTEVYESKPNPFIACIIYSILALFIFALIWMCFFKMEVIVKGDGICKCDEPVYEIGNAITGRISECKVLNGQLVHKGDVLFTIGVDSLGDNIKDNQDKIKDTKDRIDMLEAYMNNIDTQDSIPTLFANNKYYQEFQDRKQLLLTDIEINSNEINGQKKSYQGSLESISESIEQYTNKKNKLIYTKQCVESRQNNFDVNNDTYYYSIVKSYLSQYILIEAQYNSQILDYEKKIRNYDENINEISANTSDTLANERGDLVSKKINLENEKAQALNNLELQQISNIEQQIESINETLISLNANYTTTNLQLNSIDSTEVKDKRKAKVLAEKGYIASELRSCKERLKEYDSYLKSYDIKDNNCKILANATGYVFLETELKTGTYIQEGMNIGKIYPQNSNGYHATIYISNADIAKIKEGASVRLEIPSFPADDYGYFNGVIETISKDIKIDEKTGCAYYLANVKLDEIMVENSEGQQGYIMNGMQCRAKVIVDKERVITYLLREIDIWD